MADNNEQIPDYILKEIKNILNTYGINKYNYEYKNISLAGENSYGLIIQISIKPIIKDIKNDCKNLRNEYPLDFIIKLAPTNEARRKQMKVVDYYKREIFMYDHVLKEFQKLQNEQIKMNMNIFKNSDILFNAIPKIYYSSLQEYNEFIVFEDLNRIGYNRHDRKKCLTFELTALALKELGKYHAMSFVLRERKPDLFQNFIRKIENDLLFTKNTDPITIEFAKKYINKTIRILNEFDNNEIDNKNDLIISLEFIRDHFNEICLKLVNGYDAEPYAVICHGDFWNNNILYRYDDNGVPISAKILDFQMSKYASPILDIMHYLFTCTDKELRDKHFNDFKLVYYHALSDQLKFFKLNPDNIFSYKIFEKHLKLYGIYGFCMSVFAIPFYITDSNDIPDLDEVSEAIKDISECSINEIHTVSTKSTLTSTSSLTDEKKLNDIKNNNYSKENNCNCSCNNNANSNNTDKHVALLDEFELLNERTIPIFKKKMIGIVLDLRKYDMLKFQ